MPRKRPEEWFALVYFKPGHSNLPPQHLSPVMSHSAIFDYLKGVFQANYESVAYIVIHKKVTPEQLNAEFGKEAASAATERPTKHLPDD